MVRPVSSRSGRWKGCPAWKRGCTFPDPRALLRILERIRRIFDLGADPGEIARHLRAAIPGSHGRVARRPGLRVPGAWDGFELAVRAVLGQQVTVKGATTLTGRMADAFGQRSEHGLLFPTAEALAEADYRHMGLTEKRAQTLRELARAVCRGAISFDGARDLDSFVETIHCDSRHRRVDGALRRDARTGRAGCLSGQRPCLAARRRRRRMRRRPER